MSAGSGTLRGAEAALLASSPSTYLILALGSRNWESGPGVLATEVGAVENPVEDSVEE
jgi:hypothetical protein